MKNYDKTIFNQVFSLCTISDSNKNTENINHCGTFSYYFDADNKLFRSYKECDSFYPESYTLSFYEADQSIDVLCPDL